MVGTDIVCPICKSWSCSEKSVGADGTTNAICPYKSCSSK